MGKVSKEIVSVEEIFAFVFFALILFLVFNSL